MSFLRIIRKIFAEAQSIFADTNDILMRSKKGVSGVV